MIKVFGHPEPRSKVLTGSVIEIVEMSLFRSGNVLKNCGAVKNIQQCLIVVVTDLVDFIRENKILKTSQKNFKMKNPPRFRLDT